MTTFGYSVKHDEGATLSVRLAYWVTKTEDLKEIFLTETTLGFVFTQAGIGHKTVKLLPTEMGTARKKVQFKEFPSQAQKRYHCHPKNKNALCIVLFKLTLLQSLSQSNLFNSVCTAFCLFNKNQISQLTGHTFVANARQFHSAQFLLRAHMPGIL